MNEYEELSAHPRFSTRYGVHFFRLYRVEAPSSLYIEANLTFGKYMWQYIRLSLYKRKFFAG